MTTKTDPLDQLTKEEYKQVQEILALYDSDMEENEVLDKIEQEYPQHIRDAANGVMFGLFKPKQ